MPKPWIDISAPVRAGMPVWPGDPPTRLARVLDMSRGDPCTVTAIEMSAHAGTHLDAPAHCLALGPGMDAMPLDLGIGPARIITLAADRPVRSEDLAGLRIRAGERLLLKTAVSSAHGAGAGPDGDHGRLTPLAAAFLAGRGVRLVGLDALSVGPDGPEGALVHETLLSAGVWILEGLDLSLAPAGPVDLCCLPLRLAGAEGAPARAVVRPRARRTRAKTGRG